MADTKKDPAEAARLLMKNWSGSPSLSVVTAQVKATVDAIPAPAGHPVGWIDEKVIAETQDLLKASGEIETAKPLDAYYTNRLLAGGK